MSNFANLKKQSSLGSLTEKLVKQVEKMSTTSSGADERLWKPEMDKTGVGSKRGRPFACQTLVSITTMPISMVNIFKLHRLNGRLIQAMAIVCLLISHTHFLGHLSLSLEAR